MPIQIRRRVAEAAPATDAAGLLLECHVRIRDFIATALRLTTAHALPPEEIAAAAAGVHRYFAEALPLHAADEDASIAPRLRLHAPGPEVLAALDAMTREHQEHQAPLRRLLARWAELAADPASIARDDDTWRDDTRDLEAQFQQHLAAEEAVIIPAMRRAFDAAVDAELVREMRARRT